MAVPIDNVYSVSSVNPSFNEGYYKWMAKRRDLQIIDPDMKHKIAAFMELYEARRWMLRSIEIKSYSVGG